MCSLVICTSMVLSLQTNDVVRQHSFKSICDMALQKQNKTEKKNNFFCLCPVTEKASLYLIKESQSALSNIYKLLFSIADKWKTSAICSVSPVCQRVTVGERHLFLHNPKRKWMDVLLLKYSKFNIWNLYFPCLQDIHVNIYNLVNFTYIDLKFAVWS